MSTGASSERRRVSLTRLPGEEKEPADEHALRWFWHPTVTRGFILAVLGASVVVGAALGQLEHNWRFGAVVGVEVGLYVVARFPKLLLVAPAPRAIHDARVVARLAGLEYLAYRSRFAIRLTRDVAARSEETVRIPVGTANLWWATYVPFAWPLGIVVAAVLVLSAFGASGPLLDIVAVLYPGRVMWALAIALRAAGGSRLSSHGLYQARRKLVDAKEVATCEVSGRELHVMLKNGLRAPAEALDEGSSELMATILRTAWNVTPSAQRSVSGSVT